MELDPKDFEEFWRSGRYLLFFNGSESGQVIDHCLIYDTRDELFVKIEDSSVSEAVKRWMSENGVPVINELPKDARLLEDARMKLLEGGVRHEAFNRVFKELQEMKSNGATHELLNTRVEDAIVQARH